MSEEFDRCVSGRRLIKMAVEPAMVDKELNEAGFDLTSAKDSMEKNNWKWATVQSYYSMFHTAKALVLSKGYREKSHYCLLVALRELFRNKDLLERRSVQVSRA